MNILSSPFSKTYKSYFLVDSYRTAQQRLSDRDRRPAGGSLGGGMLPPGPGRL